jgi:hypothetical protein
MRCDHHRTDRARPAGSSARLALSLIWFLVGVDHGRLHPVSVEARRKRPAACRHRRAALENAQSASLWNRSTVPQDALLFTIDGSGLRPRAPRRGAAAASQLHSPDRWRGDWALGRCLREPVIVEDIATSPLWRDFVAERLHMSCGPAFKQAFHTPGRERGLFP